MTTDVSGLAGPWASLEIVTGPGSSAQGSQLREQLDAIIRDGAAPAGTKLPTVRGLAEALGLAANTVAKTYRELEAEGLLETRGRSGTFVGDVALARDAGLRAAATAYADAVRRLDATEAEAVDALLAALRG